MKSKFPTLFLCLACTYLFASQDSIGVEQLISNQNYSDALALLEKQDSTQERQLLIGSCTYRLGQWTQAKKVLHDLFTQDSNHVAVNVMLASIYDQEFNMPKAILHYNALAATDERNPTYIKNLARAHVKAGLRRLAKGYFWKARALNPKDITVLNSLAEQALYDKEWTLADSLCNLALDLDSNNLQVILSKARTVYVMKNYDSTVKYLEKTRGKLDLLPYYQKILGYSYLQLDSLDKSIHVLENLLYQEASEHTHFYLALAYQKKEDPTQSIHHYEKAIDQGISGGLGRYYAGLAAMYKAEDRMKDAIIAYGEAFTFTADPIYLFQKAQLSEHYYKDKRIALDQYRKSVSTGKLSKEQAEFANDRIRLLKEYLHQKGG